MQTVTYGRYQSVAEIPDLVEMQTKSYEYFLQPKTLPNKRKNQGLEALLREIFPIYSYDKTICLEYVELRARPSALLAGRVPQARLTYGYPFKIRVRLVKPEPVEEEIYLGEIPIMIGRRRVHHQRQPSASSSASSTARRASTSRWRSHSGEQRLHSCWIIPERGSWIELNVTQEGRRSPSASTSRASSPPRRSCARWTRSSRPTRRSCAQFYDVEKVTRCKSDPEAKLRRAHPGWLRGRGHHRRGHRRGVRAQRRRDHRGAGGGDRRVGHHARSR